MIGSIGAKRLPCFLFKNTFLDVNRWENSTTSNVLYTMTERWLVNVDFLIFISSRRDIIELAVIVPLAPIFRIAFPVA
jgi:hypothetical protein